MEITWIGHATFLIKSDNLTVMTDPWFGQSFLLRRLRPPALAPEDVPACDVMLVSHGHGDHWDAQGLALARRLGSIVVGPAPVARSARRKGLRAEVAEPGNSISAGGLEITVLSAYHPAPGGKNAVGYIFYLDGQRIYFAGDTLPNPALIFVLKKTVLDLAFLPVGAFKLLGKKVVMDVDDAYVLAREVRPRTVIPMHYGFLKGTEADPGILKHLEAEQVKVNILTPGEPVKV
ncbi:MAG: MBL fold metallo-hydrolase [Peptococcaceae bacterium]|nr:MAG: MBL fold metallo-hydrolase [Peptococcaceae bacterium]